MCFLYNFQKYFEVVEKLFENLSKLALTNGIVFHLSYLGDSS